MEVISLGGGIQSTTLVLMNLHDEIDPPASFAIFADTGWERKATYENVAALNTICLEHGFPPIWTVKTTNIRADMIAEGNGHYDHIPFYTRSFTHTGQLQLDGSEEIREGVGQLRR